MLRDRAGTGAIAMGVRRLSTVRARVVCLEPSLTIRIVDTAGNWDKPKHFMGMLLPVLGIFGVFRFRTTSRVALRAMGVRFFGTASR